MSLTFYRYRTPLCVLYPPRVIATACYVLAQRISDGPNSPSLDARISVSAPSASLPTPPSHKPPSPDASRYAIEYFTFTEPELLSVSGQVQSLIGLLSINQRHSQGPLAFSLNFTASRMRSPRIPTCNPYWPCVCYVYFSV